MKRTLLIDGDVVAYKAASVVEKAVEWHPGYWTWDASFEEATVAVRYAVDDIKDQLGGDKIVLCLSDPDANFRLDVLPTYKTHRKTVKKPLVLLPIKEWMIEELGAVMVPKLEGDDVMGILATRPLRKKEERIIVSIDKDMKTIPGLYVRTKATVDEAGVEIGDFDITEITEEDADYHWMTQTLAGDVTDGYGGCPGIGMDKARKIVGEKLKAVQYEHELLRGPRKGKVEMRSKLEPCDSLWEAVVSHFIAADLTEDDALAQARAARILRDGDYDFDRKEPILWAP